MVHQSSDEHSCHGFVRVLMVSSRIVDMIELPDSLITQSSVVAEKVLFTVVHFVACTSMC